jgi:hypothetical protein
MELLSNESERQALGKRAVETLQGQMGATQRTLEALQRLLDSSEVKRAPQDSDSNLRSNPKSH